VFVQQVIFTTELLHSSSATDQAATEPGMQVSKSDSSQREDVDGNDDGIGAQNDADVTQSANEKASERKPSKIIFKDYYVDSVRCFSVR